MPVLFTEALLVAEVRENEEEVQRAARCNSLTGQSCEDFQVLN